MSMMREQFTFRSLNSEDKDRAKELHDMCLPVKYVKVEVNYTCNRFLFCF